MGMDAHKDDDLVTYGYSSSRNITFRGEGLELGFTWGDWREMSQKDRDEALREALNNLVEIWVEGDE